MLQGPRGSKSEGLVLFNVLNMMAVELMERQIGTLLVDVSPPENPKFKCPLILVHGLWADAGCWQPWATHFSNLGWECWSINLKGRLGEASLHQLAGLKFEECLEDLKSVIRSCPQPPPLLGHGFGGILAAKVAESENVAALVLLSSTLSNSKKSPSRPLKLLRFKYFPLIMLRRPIRIHDRDVERYWHPKRRGLSNPSGLLPVVPESPYLVDDFLSMRVPIDFNSLRCPILMVYGTRDAFTPSKAVEECSAGLGAQMLVYPDCHHWIMGDEGGELIVRDVHRWLIQRLGEEILLAEFSS